MTTSLKIVLKSILLVKVLVLSMNNSQLTIGTTVDTTVNDYELEESTNPSEIDKNREEMTSESETTKRVYTLNPKDHDYEETTTVEPDQTLYYIMLVVVVVSVCILVVTALIVLWCFANQKRKEKKRFGDLKKNVQLARRKQTLRAQAQTEDLE